MGGSTGIPSNSIQASSPKSRVSVDYLGPLPTQLPPAEPETGSGLGSDSYHSSVSNGAPSGVPQPASPSAPPAASAEISGIKDRCDHQLKRIQAGSKDGDLDSAKEKSLKTKVDAIQKEFKADSANGPLTADQAHQINAALNKTNADIFLARQKSRIVKDKADGKLTSAQADALDKKMEAVAKQVVAGDDRRGDYLKELHADLKATASEVHASRDRSLYRQQPNGWACAVYSTLMATAAWGVRPENDATISEIERRLNDYSGLPGDASLVVNAVKQMSMQATYHPDGTASEIRSALQRGHTAVVNGSLGVGGHFIYVAGLNKDGTFDIWDPYRPDLKRMNDSELNAFIHGGPSNPTAFAEVWR